MIGLSEHQRSARWAIDSGLILLPKPRRPRGSGRADRKEYFKAYYLERKIRPRVNRERWHDAVKRMLLKVSPRLNGKLITLEDVRNEIERNGGTT